MPNYQADPLPPIRLINFDSAPSPQQLPTPPQDLRFLRVEEFLLARSLSANSQRAYKRELTRFLQWADRSLADVTPRQIAQFKFHLLEQGLTATSVNRALATLKNFFSWLMKAYPDLKQHNPTEPVLLEKVPLPPARDLSSFGNLVRASIASSCR
jgi:integrase/recombinase XerD